MNLLQDGRWYTIMNGRGRFLTLLSVSSIISQAIIIFLLMISTIGTIDFFSERTLDFGFMCELESKLFRFINLILTRGGLFYAILRYKFILPSLLSFGTMFTLSIYLFLLSLRFNRKRIIRRRVSYH